jgi:hypothetical protein
MPRLQNVTVSIPYAMMVVPPVSFRIADELDPSRGRALRWFQMTYVAATLGDNVPGDVRILVDGGLRFCWPLGDLSRRSALYFRAGVADAAVELSQHICGRIVDRIRSADPDELEGGVEYLGQLLEMLGSLALDRQPSPGLQLKLPVPIGAGDEVRVIVPEDARCHLLLGGEMGVDVDAKWDHAGRLVEPSPEVTQGSS